MNGVNEEKYQLRLTQTSKGVFYVDKVGVDAETQEELISEMQKLATAVVVLLDKLNSGLIDRSQVKEK